MDADQIRRLKPKLSQYLREFDDCFRRKDTRGHFPKYVEGQLSDLPRKSVEPIALKTGVPVRTLQEFLSQHKWDEDRMTNRLQQIVVRDHASPQAIGIIDETSFVKKGDKTPGVQRQHCGTVGKLENCIVTVHLGYAADGFHCVLDGELFIPESWSQDRQRCRAAGIPDEVVHRPKSEIAIELYDRARDNGVKFQWVTFDEWYGSKPQFLRALEARGQHYIGEVPKSFTAWITPPRVTERAYRRGGRGRGKKTPRVIGGSPKPMRVDHLLKYHPALRDQAWQRWHVKDTEKGPEIWEVKHVVIYLPDERGLPGEPHHLLVARNVLHLEEIKFFVAWAEPETTVAELLRPAFSRWPIERCFEDKKGELGLAHYEGRSWTGLKRHLALSAVSFLFLAQVQRELGKKNPGADRLPSAYRRGGSREVLVAQGPRRQTAV